VTPASSPERALAHRLLAREGGAHATPGEAVAASDRLLRQLHAQLARWLGRDGSHAVLARALDRTRADHQSLAGATLDPRGPRLLVVGESLRDRDPAEVTEALVVLLTAVLDLLTRLIGAELLSRLLLQAWPNGTIALVPPEPSRPAPGATPAIARAGDTTKQTEDAPDA
jgi:hypothetical protein